MELKGYEELGGDDTGMKLEAALRKDYVKAEAPFEGVGAWFYRVSYTANEKGPTAAIAHHQAEWRAILNEVRARSGKPAIQWAPSDFR
jgi:hypothetical protein